MEPVKVTSEQEAAMNNPTQEREMQQMRDEIANFDRVYDSNVQNGWKPAQFRTVTDHTRPGQFRVQHFAAMMSGVPQGTKVFTGMEDERKRYVASQLKQFSDAAV